MNSDSLIGQTIGNYEILGRLGKGGMAVVYRARQISMQRDVAIKVMSGDLAEDPQFVARFEREAQVIANLQHPRILPVHDFGHQGEIFYLVMRLIEGDTLYHRLEAGALPLVTAGRTLIQIAEALDYAHSQGVVHRDLKPNNVLIDELDNLYLMDFGLAKMLASSTHLTASGAILGTPAYMAPEQWRGENVDARGDVYSLGVILYEMVTGRTPFESDTPYTLMYKHINDAPPPPRTLIPDLPEQIEGVLLKALAKDRGDRYSSAGDLARAYAEMLHAANVQGCDILQPPTSQVELRGDARPQSDPALESAVPASAPPQEEPGANLIDSAAVDISEAHLPTPEGRPMEETTAGAGIHVTPEHLAPPDNIAPPPPSVPPIPTPGRPVATPPADAAPAPPRGPAVPPHPAPRKTPVPAHPMTPPGGMRDFVDQIKESSVWQSAMEMVERGLETALEHAAESAPISEHTNLATVGSSDLLVNTEAFEHVRGVLRPDEQLVGVLDVRGTPEWMLWKKLLIGGFVLNVLGAITTLGILSTLGVLAWLFVFVQGVRTWRGSIGRYYIGFTSERVIFLPRDEDENPDVDDAQAANWGVIDRLRLHERYMLLDVPNSNGKDFRFAGLVLAQGEGGLGDQMEWLPDSPLTHLIADQGFHVCDELR